MYEIMFKGEVIDEADTIREASFMRQEYSMAYKGHVYIRKKKSKKDD